MITNIDPPPEEARDVVLIVMVMDLEIEIDDKELF